MKHLLSSLLASLALIGLADDPSFAFLNRGTYYPVGRALAFPFSSCQVTNLDVKVSKCYVNNLNAYRIGSEEMKSRMTEVAATRIELKPPYAAESNRMLELGDLLKGREPGFYHLQVDTGIDVKQGSSWWSWTRRLKDECIFALTDLGLAAEVVSAGADPKAVVLVHGLHDGRPVKGATVYVLTRANQVAGQAVTDARGIAEVSFAASYRPSEDTVYGVMATKDKDVSYLQLDWNTRLRSRDGDQDAFADARAFLFAERDLCRPGESFDTGLFLRSSPQGGMKALGNAPVDLELWDSSDNRVETRRVKTDRWGFVAASWPIPASARVGAWTVVARLAKHELGRFVVNVSAYVPDRFRVELKAALSPVAGARRPPAFSGAAVYYFGENVREAEWKMTAAAELAPALPQWSGWTVGTGEISEVPAWKEEGEISDAVFAADYPDDRFQRLLESKSPVLLRVGADVTPPGARTVSVSASVRIDASDRYIGLREGTTPIKGLRAFDLAFLPAVEGGKVSGASDKISVRVIRREWKCHAVEADNGKYRMEWREERSEVKDLARQLAPGSLTYKASDLAAGSYTLVATCGLLETRLDFWHWKGEVSDRSVSPAELNLKADAEKVLPGGKVKLSFKSAFAGRAYVAAGERGLERTDTFAVKPGENSFTVPVRADAASAYTYVAVTVLNEDAPNALRLSGLARVRVDHSGRRYPLDIDLPKVACPGETVRIKVRAGGPGLVRLMAVDEGVLALSAYESPDPFASLYDYDFGCPFDIYDLYSSIYPDLKLLPNGQIGGGGLGAAIRRRNVRTRRDSTLKQRETARVVLPPVEIPASGEVDVPMTLPAFTGSLRVMAVAADDHRAGSADRSIIVRDAASLFVNAPRCATGGDRYELTAEIFNHDLPASEWTLTVAGRAFSGRLAQGASTNVSFRCEVPANAVGPMALAGILRIDGQTFRDDVTLTVRAKHPPVVQVACAVRRRGDPRPPSVPAQEEWLRLDEDAYEECGTPKPVLATALGWLADYPYGCLEQTTAAAFPFVFARELRQLGLADEAAESNAVVKVKAAYGEIMQMALEDGGFSMWPGGKDVWTDGSLFALHFVFAAERQGLVKPEPREKLIRWLRRRADGNDPRTRLDRAYAAYVLALAGEETFNVAAGNVIGSDKDAVDYATFLAAAALVRGGRLAEGAVPFRKAIASHVWARANLPASDGWSRTRLYGMTLAIAAPVLAAAKDDGLPSEVAPLVVKLMESIRSDGTAWGTTRDNAWATAGLAAFCSNFGSDLVFSRRIRSGIPRVEPACPEQIRVWRTLPAKVKRGELVDVEIRLASAQEVTRAVLCDLLPGGFEIEDSSLKTRSQDDSGSFGGEIRDDRWLWFGGLPKIRPSDKPLVLRYRVRATTRGTFAVPALTVEDMYDPDFAGRIKAAGTVTVE